MQRIITLDSQLVLEAYNEAHDFQYIETNSQIIEELIQMDKVKPLIDSVSLTLQETINISSATQELTASINEVADQSVQLSDQSDEMMKQAKRVQHTIREALNDFSVSAQEVSDASQQFEEFLQYIYNITDIIDLIRNVADQTNLLALNASIEAARAGEQGLGFAVVASQVRKLSEETKQAVGQITQVTSKVLETANTIGEGTKLMGSQIAKRVEVTNGAISGLDQIMDQIESFSEFTANVASIVEQQAAATSDITDRTTIMLGHQEEIQQYAMATGSDIYNVSKKVNSLRMESLNINSHLSDIQILRTVKTDHLLWRWRVYNSLLGLHHDNNESDKDGKLCRLGKWYEQNKNNHKLASLPSFQALVEPHARVHHLAEEALESIRINRRDQAESLIIELEQASQNVVHVLEQLKQEMINQFRSVSKDA
ncbi:methyl-accepting chemotaxis protein [Paenibacillus sp. D2_2]|uniref:methyl-accepting chemotaxis protein n=1 Tax=Paenibacillus sp. D2_2 TaxID=3073092 RepID=UPI0028166237|nr:methyl-accepting chemotaxis protein [Paenibacillus sp. D2_2]WMT39868.1 methyl-accepting chemotaxis protein [Paenibacillus sp. D2_2]